MQPNSNQDLLGVGEDAAGWKEPWGGLINSVLHLPF